MKLYNPIYLVILCIVSYIVYQFYTYIATLVWGGEGSLIRLRKQTIFSAATSHSAVRCAATPTYLSHTHTMLHNFYSSQTISVMKHLCENLLVHI